MRPFDFQLRTRVVFRPGAFSDLGREARALAFSKTLIVSDPGIVDLGLVQRAVELLRAAGIETATFHDFGANPDSDMVERGRAAAAAAAVDSIVGLGGGSALDCAKGINFVHTNGGSMRDYRGHGKAARPMLPMIAVPTTAGTGSDAQSYALISDARTHEKMACGDEKAAFRVALLDPELTLTMPSGLTAAVGYDAVSHAVESFVTRSRNGVSDMFAREAWRLLSAAFPRVVAAPGNLEARGDMMIGAHYAGIAIEQSMLGSTHACANPLTARYGITHGVAIAVMLPHVVRWNSEVVGERYDELRAVAGWSPEQTFADRLAAMARDAGLPGSLGELGVERSALGELSEGAALQWTGTHNPRPFTGADALALYERAFEPPAAQPV